MPCGGQTMHGRRKGRHDGRVSPLRFALWRMAGLFAALAMLATPATARGDRTPERQAMVETIQAMALSIASVLGQAGLEPRVLAALRTVPRHEFVPREVSHLAYSNRPLPIGHGQ